MKWIVLVIVLAAAGFGGWKYWSSKNPTSGPVEFRSAAVAKGDVTQSVSANGQLSPIKTVAVGSQISGQITNLTVDFNSTVKEGQLLAEIDSGTYMTRMKSAKADLANSQASLELAELNFKRSEELLKNRLIAQSEYDQTRVQRQQAKAQVLTREAAVDTAEVDLSRATIYAPISGVVISRNVDIGQTVAASLNTPTLMTIANDLRKMQIDAMVSEADVGNVTEGLNVEFTVDAFPGRPFKGIIRQVRFAAITNQNVVNYSAIIDVANDDLKLRPGMTTTATIITGQKKAVLRVPKTAFRVKPPEASIIKSESGTNATAIADAAATNAPVALGPDGMPIPPWTAQGRRPESGEREKWMATLTPEQKKVMEDRMAQMRARFAEGGGAAGAGGGFGGGRGGGAGGAAAAVPRLRVGDAPVSQSLYLLVKTNSPDGKPMQMARRITIKTGLEDATNVEVLDGLKEGDEVITGLVVTETATAARPAGGAPGGIGSPFGGGGFRGR